MGPPHGGSEEAGHGRPPQVSAGQVGTGTGGKPCLLVKPPRRGHKEGILCPHRPAIGPVWARDPSKRKRRVSQTPWPPAPDGRSAGNPASSIARARPVAHSRRAGDTRPRRVARLAGADPLTIWQTKMKQDELTEVNRVALS